MFGDIEYALRNNLRDREYAESYAESFLNGYIATQIKVIREQRRLTQAELGNLIGTTQAGISRLENVNYSSWSLRTLIKLAQAFDVRLKVSFEAYGTLPDEVVRFDRSRLERVERERDPRIMDSVAENRDLENIVDIGAAKALRGLEEKANDLNFGGSLHGGDSNLESASIRANRIGRTNERREDSPLRLYSNIGG